eukprot:1159388-Pelagomonas_calceolata.AAC.12
MQASKQQRGQAAAAGAAIARARALSMLQHLEDPAQRLQPSVQDLLEDLGGGCRTRYSECGRWVLTPAVQPSVQDLLKLGAGPAKVTAGGFGGTEQKTSRADQNTGSRDFKFFCCGSKMLSSLSHHGLAGKGAYR